LRLVLSIGYAIEGDLRFISHHDTVRLFERALARADLPVRRSNGFNPRPRLSLPVPRGVGVASSDERLVVELASPLEPDEVLRRLAPQMPDGLRLMNVHVHEQANTPVRATHVTYRLPLKETEYDALRGAVEHFSASGQCLVARKDATTGRVRSIDVRGYVTRMRLEADGLIWTQVMTQAGTARPSEVLEALGLDSGEYLHRLHRTRVDYA
jgi:radical SAM-linked protein